MKVIFNKTEAYTARIQLTGVAFSYDRVPVFNGLDLQIAPTSLTVVVGANGCGKSTLLDLIAGVRRPDRGHVHVSVTDVAYAVQRSRAGDNFPLTRDPALRS